MSRCRVSSSTAVYVDCQGFTVLTLHSVILIVPVFIECLLYVSQYSHDFPQIEPPNIHNDFISRHFCYLHFQMGRLRPQR